MANQSPRPALPVNVPVNYPTTPGPGKIQILYDANSRDLYHKLSPYGSDTFFGIKTRQPFNYVYPDDHISSMQKNVSQEFPFAAAITDVQRITKFMVSGPGILWIGKQFLLQTGNAFNETRIWNPTSPIVGAAMPLTLWAARPQRNIDTSDLLGSLLGSVGSFIGGLFGTGTKPPSPPSGTVAGALPSNSVTATWGAKGLLRAGTANPAKNLLVNKWPIQAGGTSGFSLGGFLSETIKGMFGNFLPQSQNASRRSDEITYGLMLGSSGGENGPFTYNGVNGAIDGVQQFWFGGSTDIMRKGAKTPVLLPLNWKKLYVNENGLPIWEKPTLSVHIDGLQGGVGYDVADTSNPVRYGDNVGTEHGDDWAGSDELIQFAKYADLGTQYPSKLNYPQDPSVVAMNASLQKVINDIKRDTIYSIASPDSPLLMGNQSQRGYNQISTMKKHNDPEVSYRHSVLSEYRKNIGVLENQHTDQKADNSKKMASTRQFDGINTLKVLGADKKIDNGLITGWTEWHPYRDDQIAFYFYDIVNQKYIPFRAIIHGLQETDSANWEELSFLGRADRVYSYSGFNRSLTFSFTVHISSLIELAPTWQRINYLMSLIKPSRYTTNKPKSNPLSLYTRFMVPPMVMVTIGDLYKNQPIVIGSAGITIPDTAIWETLNLNNSDEWFYLKDYIKSPIVGKLYAQMPLTAEISINAFILEQERAIVGAAHFGSAPHTEQYQDGDYRAVEPLNTSNPSEFSKNLVVYNK